MSSQYKKLLVSTLFLFFSEASLASLVTFAFEGEVTSSNKPDVFAIGQYASGRISFDSSVEDSSPYDPEVGSYVAVENVSFTTEGYSANARGVGDWVTIFRDSFFTSHLFSVFVIRTATIQDPQWGPDINGEQLVRMGLELEGGTQQPIVSTELPLTAPDISLFDSAEFGLFYESDPTSSAGVKVSLTSLTTVPVPAAAWLFGSGLVALAGVMRSKKQT